MKRFFAIAGTLVIALGAMLALSAYQTKKMFGDILTELGMEKRVAESYMEHAFMQGKLSSPKSLYMAYKWNAGKRKEALDELAKLVKDYTASEAFKQVYLKQQMKNQISELDYSELKIQAEHMLPQMEEYIKKREAQGKKVDESTMANIKALREAKKKVEAYEQAKKGTPEPGFKTVQGGFIARRLQEFLDLSATVDYEAKLKKQGTKMVFENEEYESKSEDWKKCYRAGKELTEEARRLCREWIAELKTTNPLAE